MRKLAEVPFGTKKVIVRELSVAQVISIIESMSEADEVEPKVLDWAHGNEYMSQEILEIIIDDKIDQLMNDEVTQFELKALYKKALELNPSLAGALTSMRKAGEMFVKNAELMLQQFEQMQSSSSIGDTSRSGSTGFPSSWTSLKNSVVPGSSGREEQSERVYGGGGPGQYDQAGDAPDSDPAEVNCHK